MQNQHLPVLILAQSGRFIAQSATQAGYRVWVADCFGDQDTLDIAERWQQLDPISSLSEKHILKVLSILSQGEHCLLVCGSGVEHYYPVLNKLPKNIKLVGNTASTIDTVQTPFKFFSLLKQLKLAYPETQYKTPTDDDWLTKSPSGFGGIHIQHLNQNRQQDDIYYQRYISGISGSGLFLANGEKAQLLSINQQYLRPCKEAPFRLGSLTSPWSISEQHQQQLELAMNKITSKIGLCGINSIDFIISEQNQMFILELNPRISASAELLNKEISLFKYHLNACIGLLPDIPVTQAVSSSILSYLYADNDVVIHSNMIWPITCHDIPRAGTVISKNEPICTLQIQAETIELAQQRCHEMAKETISQLK